jgi:hypothetical protein
MGFTVTDSDDEDVTPPPSPPDPAVTYSTVTDAVISPPPSPDAETSPPTVALPASATEENETSPATMTITSKIELEKRAFLMLILLANRALPVPPALLLRGQPGLTA